jgi:hypothetical protein
MIKTDYITIVTSRTGVAVCFLFLLGLLSSVLTERAGHRSLSGGFTVVTSWAESTSVERVSHNIFK